MTSNSSVNRTNFQSFDKSLNASVNLQSPFVSVPLDVQQYSGSSSTLTFIDSSVNNYQSLVSGINPETEVYVLNSSEDAISQITKTLLAREGISSLHIISHGQAGELDFASGVINSSNISNYAGAIRSWSQALTSDADILLYGCDVASGELGTAFLQDLSELTDADVAASNNLTGSTAKGGDWVLETVTGKIEASSALQMGTMEAYNSVLANINTPFRIINNPTPAANEEFGFAIASHSTSILVGVPKGNKEGGEAYRYTTGGLLQSTFVNSSTGSAERFGFAVALTGDNNSIIGASNFGDPDVGRAYQFDKTGINTQNFENSTSNDDSEFGTAITILNNGTIVVAAPEKDKNKANDNAGQVRLFKSDGTHIKDINNPSAGTFLDPLQDARFGSALANANGNILIGAPGYTLNFAIGSGRAYLYDVNADSLRAFNNPNSTSLDFFGISVASNSTGTRFLIGAPGEDLDGDNAGVAYLFDNNGKLLNNFANPNPQIKGFGSAVAFVGNDIVVGAPGGFTFSDGKITPVPSIGGVYVFDGDGSTPTYTIEHTISNPNSGNDGFGGAISVIDNNKIAIGAPYYDAGTNADAGIAYIYKLSNNAPSVNNISKSSNEDSTINFSISDFGSKFTDIDGDILTKIRISSLPQNGTLKFNNLNVTLNHEIDVANISQLTFTPAANYKGTTSFRWNGYDGASYAATSATVSLTINPTSSAWEVVATGYFENDTKQDILQRNFSTGGVRLANPGGNPSVLQPNMDINWSVISTADFTGDNKADILWRNMSTGETRVWEMNGANIVSNSTTFQGTNTRTTASLDWQIISATDFTGDNKADILWRHVSYGETRVWQMNGANIVSHNTTYRDTNTRTTFSNTWQVISTADFTGDKNADILWRNSSSGETVVWRMDGAKITSSATTFQGTNTRTIASLDWQIVSTVDFNNNGKADILWRHVNGGETRIWNMDGAKILTHSTITSNNQRLIQDLNWQVISTADFNNDNKADIFWRHKTTGETRLWQMNLANIVINSAITGAPSSEWQLFKAANLYGDSKVDSLWVNSNSQAKIVQVETNSFGEEVTILNT